MQKVLTAEQMREVDRLTTEKYGIPSILLMENAAHAVARVITEKLGGSVKGKSVLILCGKGNNGGDGAALARILWTQGAKVDPYLIGSINETNGDAATNFRSLDSLGRSSLLLEEIKASDELFAAMAVVQKMVGRYEIIVDAMFGTGLKGRVNAPFDEIIAGFDELREVEIAPIFRLSIDIPSGLDSESAAPIGPIFRSDATVTFTAPKPANVLAPASWYNGLLEVVNIGSPQELINEQPSQFFLAESEDMKNWFVKTEFSNDSYKNKRGHARLIVGSESFSGAAVLAGDAAMRSGVGLVTVVTPKSSKDSVASRVLPEVMVCGVADTGGGAISEEAFDEIGELLSKADSIAIGCGLSQDEDTRAFVQKVIENRQQATIVDADALNLLSPFAGFAANGESQYPLILTPHEGEFMRLLGTDDKDAIWDRVVAVREFAVKNNVILVLKGERVLIGEPGGKVVVNPTGNSGLGKAGNGDTLTGILAGFVAQASALKIDIFETVIAAVYIAGMAGDIAEKKYGKRVMTASDVRECLVDVFEAFDS